jgi:hypothetical protein
MEEKNEARYSGSNADNCCQIRKWKFCDSHDSSNDTKHPGEKPRFTIYNTIGF